MAEKKREEEIEQEKETKTEKNEKNEIEELKKKLEECEEKYLRVFADFENTKKRLEREKYQALEYAYEQFARDLLPALDSLDMALATVSSENLKAEEAVEKLKEGIELTIEQFAKAFGKHGIEMIEIGEGFNPHLHEAILHVESPDHEEGEIVQVLQKGYKYKERVLRPTKVSIAKGKKSE
ncbi:nucleotide exchange factor GrpE [Nitrosophilus alvini]|uniref:nucleotide exchange factor GrpE n=1 Tax=Nitrosophilus alvini TaxID=2714855 RepID=UPI001909AAC3|nr:nucleotide exchange factor GrpE [Nitrosophilus alvini]